MSSTQCLCCSTGLKLSCPKTKLQNVGAGDPSSTILIDHDSCCPSNNWSSTARVAHQGSRSWGGEVLTPWKYVGRVRVCFDPLIMLHSVIQNCCCITAIFTASRMNSWTLAYHFIDPAYADDATILMSDQLQADSILQSMHLLLYWIPIVAKDKTPERGCKWPAINNPHSWCTSWRSRGVHLSWQ